VVYDVHEDVPRDIESKQWIPDSMRRLIGALFERFENITASHLSGVVAATPCIGQRFGQVNPTTITVNNYPISGELYQGGAPPHFSAKARPYICYAGGISAIRGVHEMVSAIVRTDVHMLLAGSFSSEKLRDETMRLPGWERVEFVGQVARPNLAIVLKRCFAGLVMFHPEANHIHAQPNKLFEYMSAGIPIIASNFPLWRTLVEGVGCGICVDPFDIHAIAEAITFLDRNRDRAKAMGAKGLSAVAQKFNWEQEQTVLIDLYKRLLIK
jgi:glycosyltransferase involved in cell wall biosynthesis